MSSSNHKEAARTLTIMVVPDGTNQTRTYRVGYGRLRLLGAAAALVGAVVLGMAGSWMYLASRATQVTEVEARIDSLAAEGARVQALSAQLADLEGRYQQMVDMFGAGSAAPSDLWLPPAGGRSGGVRAEPEGAIGPTSWPLAERGFITQPLLAGVSGEHPGLDIAIPTDSYIRAAGGGTVADVAEDPVYGHFVLLDHGDGYRSLYAHASLALVERGDSVRRNEVIALSGSTGRSTAPHLHFEILKDGEPVDPLTLVRQP